MLSERLRAVTTIAAASGAGAAVLTRPASARWLGLPDGAGRHVVVAAGAGLVVAAGDAAALATALRRAGLRPHDPVAVDAPGLALGHPVLDAAEALDAERMVKDDRELALIARAARLVDAGQAAARAAAVAGATEDDLWMAAAAAMRAVAGAPVEAGVDLMAGARTALVGEPPDGTVLRAGDPVLFDLAPCRDGYWADSCATFACGAPPAALARRHDAVRRALEVALERARPGVSAGALDAAVRAVLAKHGLSCPHHIGHGVGTAPQEAPWILPGRTTVLREGMVVALEPGAYAGGFGVRLEHLAVVRPDGAVPLTSHDLSLS
ncbi:MAG: aminopeptidase P family protein [Thermoleophilia bacterium]|nr:aminopeptidase P family protein [Thermoleophilia bacterium]